MRVGLQPAGRVVLLERQAERGERLARRGRVRGRQHQRAVGVLGDADDPGDVHAALRERRRDARERTRPIVELDREPDRHAAPPAAARWYPRAVAASGAASHRATLPRRCLPRSARRRPRRCPTSRSSGATTRRDTRAALRFFRERRVVVHYVDLRKRPIAPGELRAVHRAARRARAARRDVAPYRDGGLAYLQLDDAGIVARLLADPRLLRLPLVRRGNEVTVGRAEATWAGWLRSAAGALSAVDADDDADHDQERRPGDRPARVVDHEARAADEAQALADPDDPDERRGRRR